MREEEQKKLAEMTQIKRLNQKTLLVFRDLIHIFQVHARSRGDIVLPFSIISTCYAQKAYGATLPINYEVGAYVDLAVQKNIIIEVDSGSTEKAYKMSSISAKWEVPLPASISSHIDDISNLEDAWRELMTWLVCHMSGKQKKDQLLKKLGEWPNLLDVPAESLEALVSLCVFRGILMEQDGIYKRNKIIDVVPVDYTAFPGNEAPRVKEHTSVPSPIVSAHGKVSLAPESPESDKKSRRKSDNPKKKK